MHLRTLGRLVACGPWSLSAAQLCLGGSGIDLRGGDGRGSDAGPLVEGFVGGLFAAGIEYMIEDLYEKRCCSYFDSETCSAS